MTSSKKYNLILHDYKIQSFLAVLSFVEKNINSIFVVTKINSLFFERIKKIFNQLKLTENLSGSINVNVEIDHKIPKTKIYNHEKKLIFPNLIRSYIKNKKNKKIVFVGLLTNSRKFYILKFLYKINFKDFIRFFIYQILNKKKFIGDKIDIYSSIRGRNIEFKYWDSEYYKLISKYKYCLCPPGDYLWTYRYYECILTGGIPLVLKKNKVVEEYGSLDYKDFLANKKYQISGSDIKDINKKLFI